jgi:hypothetical protein
MTIPDDHRRAVEGLLGARITSADALEERPHVLRLVLDDGRTAVYKRPREEQLGRRSFDAECTSLELLAGMPTAVAPRLLGTDPERRFVLVEELPPGRSLATSLVEGDAATARADLLAYAEAIAAVHAWSRGRELPDLGTPWWAWLVRQNGEGFPDVDAVLAELEGGPFTGFVHADLCPDNVRIVDGACRIFDFEDGAVGSTAIDAAYLLAPFASCWCFGPLPDGEALAAYEAAAGVGGGAWDRALAAALAGFLLARAPDMVDPDDDRPWGRTTMYVRLRHWTGHWPRIAEHFPALGRRFEELHDRFAGAADPPPYPAFAVNGGGAPPRSPAAGPTG